MDVRITYRGRSVSEADIASIKTLIADHPTASRRKLSELLCDEWGWMQPNGTRCAMIARSFMLALHRAGHIELPEPRRLTANPLAQRRPPSFAALGDDLDTTPLRQSLSQLKPLEFRLVRRTPQEAMFNALIERYHYLGYVQPVGAHLKYMIFAQGRPLACVSFSSPPYHLNVRDRFIGWSREVRQRHLHFIAYNSRYLILPWVEVRHLASHLLGRLARRVSVDWQKAYGHPLHYLETFVDPMRYRGTCYRAANWVVLGLTKGKGHRSKKGKSTLPIKEILGYPLRQDFRKHLLGLNS